MYRNQFTSQYKQEEKLIRQIINRHVKATNSSSTVKLCIYYRNNKLRKYLISNKSSNNKGVDSRVVYQYTCKESTCNGASYIGYTTCTLPVRFYSHVQHGSIQKHNREKHNSKLYTQQLLENTKILHKNQSTVELKIAEALLIKHNNPTLNAQDEGNERVLHIF